MTVSQVFRKYHKHLMVGLLVFLMVSWLAADYLTPRGGQSRGDALWGTAWGQKVYRSDLQAAANDQAILQRSGVLGALMGSGHPLAIGLVRAMLDRNEGALNYYLLREEVLRSGVLPSPAGVASFRHELGITPARIAEIRDELQVPSVQIEAAIARAVAVLDLAQLVNGGPRVSLPQLAALVRTTQERVQAEHVDLPISLFLAGPEPTPADLAAQFEKYKSALPNAERPPVERDAVGFGLGYCAPARVQVEALVFDVEPVLAVLRQSEPNPQKLLEFYNNNQNRYEEAPPPSTQPGKVAPRQRPYSEVHAQVKADYLLNEARSRVLQMANEARRIAFRPWSGRLQQDGTYTPLPQAQWESYADVAGLIEKQYKVRPAVVLTDLVSRTDLETRHADLAGVRLPAAGQIPELSLGQYAFYVSPIAKQMPGVPLGPLALGQDASEALVDRLSQGSALQLNRAVVFRVVKATPSAPPAGLDAVVNPATQEKVVDRVRADWVRMRALERARAVAEKVAARARQVGLAQALLEDPSLLRDLTPAPLSQPAQSAPADPKAADWVGTLAMAQSLLIPDRNVAEMVPNLMGGGPGRSLLTTGTVPGLPEAVGQEVVRAMFAAVQSASTQPAASQPGATAPVAVAVVDLPSMGAVRIVQINAIDRVPAEMASLYEQLYRRPVEMRALGESLATWFDPDSIRARADFRPDPSGPLAPRETATGQGD